MPPVPHAPINSIIRGGKPNVTTLKKAGPKATRESVLQAMSTLGRVDLGGYVLNVSPTSRHGSTMVDLTILSRGDRFVQ